MAESGEAKHGLGKIICNRISRIESDVAAGLQPNVIKLRKLASWIFTR